MAARWEITSGARIIHALVLVFLMASTFPVGFGLIGPMLGLEMSEVFSGNERAMLTTALMGLYSIGGIVGLGLFALGRVRPADVGWRSERPARDIGAGLFGAVALVGCMLAIVSLFGLELGTFVDTVTRFTGSQRAQMLLIGVIAGVGEETVFRGYLQPALCSRMGAIAGILLTAAIFALYHLPMTPHVIGISAKFAFGLVLGLLRHKTGSLWPPAIAHFTFWQIMGFA